MAAYNFHPFFTGVKTSQYELNGFSFRGDDQLETPLTAKEQARDMMKTRLLKRLLELSRRIGEKGTEECPPRLVRVHENTSRLNVRSPYAAKTLAKLSAWLDEAEKNGGHVPKAKAAEILLSEPVIKESPDPARAEEVKVTKPPQPESKPESGSCVLPVAQYKSTRSSEPGPSVFESNKRKAVDEFSLPVAKWKSSRVSIKPNPPSSVAPKATKRRRN